MTAPKKLNPETHFVCADCKRTLPVGDRHASRLVCADRSACRIALAEWLAKQTFAQGVAAPPATP
jgi:hypothetical protein